jgi:hypothetical protein
MPMTLGAKPDQDKSKEEEDPLDWSDTKRHPLFENMENARFLIVKAPNIESMNLAV